MPTIVSLKEHFRQQIGYRRELLKSGVDKAAETKSLLEKMLLADTPSAVYEKFTAECEKEFFEWVLASNRIDRQKLAEPISAKENAEFLEECVAKWSSLYGRAGIAMSLPSLALYEDKTKCAISGTTVCYVLAEDHDPEFLKINKVKHKLNAVWPKDSKDDCIVEENEEPVPLRDGLLTIAHEMRHFFHMSLATAYNCYKLNEGDPFFEDGKYYREMVRFHGDKNGYIQSAENISLNKMQLDERQAYGCGGRLNERLTEYLTKDIPDFVKDVHPAMIPAQRGARVLEPV